MDSTCKYSLSEAPKCMHPCPCGRTFGGGSRIDDPSCALRGVPWGKPPSSRRGRSSYIIVGTRGPPTSTSPDFSNAYISRDLILLIRTESCGCGTCPRPNYSATSSTPSFPRRREGGRKRGQSHMSTTGAGRRAKLGVWARGVKMDGG